MALVAPVAGKITRLRVNVISNLMGAAWLALLQVLVVPLYVATLGIEGYGLIGFHLTLAAALRILDLGLSPTINREMARLSVRGDDTEARDLARTLEVAYWLIAAAIGGGLWLAATTIAERWLTSSRLPTPVVVDALRAMAVLIALQWPVSLYQGALLGLQRQVLVNAVKAGMTTAAAVGALLALWFVQPSITAFFAAQIVVAVGQVAVLALLMWRSLPRGARAVVRPAMLRQTSGFAAGMSGIALLSLVLTQADKLLLSRFLTLEQFGTYALAGVIGSALTAVNAPIFNAFFPRFTALVAGGEGATVARLFRMAAQWVAVATVPAALVIVVFAREILTLWVGDSTAAVVAPLVGALTLGTALNGLMNLPYALQLAHASTSIPLMLNGLLVVTYFPLLVVATTRLGALGAAWAWLAVNAVYVVVGVTVTTRRLLDTSARPWFVDIGRVAVAALAIVLAWRLGLGARAPVGVAGLAILAAILATATAGAIAVVPDVRRAVLGLVALRRRG